MTKDQAVAELFRIIPALLEQDVVIVSRETLEEIGGAIEEARADAVRAQAMAEDASNSAYSAYSYANQAQDSADSASNYAEQASDALEGAESALAELLR